MKRPASNEIFLFALDAVMGFLWCCSLTPYNIVPLFWLCLFYFFHRLERAKSPRTAALIGWAWGNGFCWSAYYWLVHTLYNFGGIPVAIAIPMIAIYQAIFAVEFLLLGFLVKASFDRFSDRPWQMLLWSSVFFAFLDGFFPQHFPNGPALLFAPFPFWLQTADLWGDLGVSWILIISALGLWLVIRRWKIENFKALQFALPAVIALAVFSAYGMHASKKWQNFSSTETVRLAGIQANIGNIDKLESRKEGNKRVEVIRRYFEPSQTAAARGVDLIVWPETAFPDYVSVSKVLAPLLEAMAQLKTDFLMGGMDAIRENGHFRFYNGVFLIDHQDRKIVQSYYKSVLLALGEYVPLGKYLPFIQKMIPSIGGFTPGAGPAVMPWKDKNGKEHKLGVSICYEAILPTFVNRLAALNPEIFINITNDSWFGETREPYFHFYLQAMRAVEYRRFLYRLANTGLSAVVSPYGTVTQMTTLNTQETLLAEIPLISETPTFYNRFGFWGLRVALLGLTAVALIKLRPLRR